MGGRTYDAGAVGSSGMPDDSFFSRSENGRRVDQRAAEGGVHGLEGRVLMVELEEDRARAEAAGGPPEEHVSGGVDKQAGTRERIAPGEAYCRQNMGRLLL